MCWNLLCVAKLFWRWILFLQAKLLGRSLYLLGDRQTIGHVFKTSLLNSRIHLKHPIYALSLLLDSLLQIAIGLHQVGELLFSRLLLLDYLALLVHTHHEQLVELLCLLRSWKCLHVLSHGHLRLN